MRSFIFALLVAATLAIASVGFAADPNLVGTWQGPITLHSSERGFASNDGSKGEIIIMEQQDGAFHGKKVWNRGEGDRVEEFSGVISLDGKALYITGAEDGYYVGEVLGPDELVLYYLEDGMKAKAMRHHLKRKK